MSEGKVYNEQETLEVLIRALQEGNEGSDGSLNVENANERDKRPAINITEGRNTGREAIREEETESHSVASPEVEQPRRETPKNAQRTNRETERAKTIVEEMSGTQESVKPDAVRFNSEGRLVWGGSNFPEFIKRVGNNVSFIMSAYFEVAKVGARSEREASRGQKALQEFIDKVIYGVKEAQGGAILSEMTKGSSVAYEAAKTAILVTEINDLLFLLEYIINCAEEIRSRYGIELQIDEDRTLTLQNILESNEGANPSVRDTDVVGPTTNNKLSNGQFTVTIPAIKYIEVEEEENTTTNNNPKSKIAQLLSFFTRKEHQKENKTHADYHEDYLKELDVEQLKTIASNLIKLNRTYVRYLIEGITKASGWDWTQTEPKISASGVPYNNVQGMRLALKIRDKILGTDVLSDPYGSFRNNRLEKAFETYEELIKNL